MPFQAVSASSPIHEIKAALFKAMGHPVRVRVLELLTPGERPVSELLTETGLEASHLSQHLTVLRRTGLVTARRTGNTVHYALAHPSVVDLLSAARTFLVAALSDTRDALDDLEQQLVRAADTRAADTGAAGAEDGDADAGETPGAGAEVAR